MIYFDLYFYTFKLSGDIKMSRIIFATTNEGKLNEVKQLLINTNIELISLNIIKNKNIPNVDETGTTFLENALLKARTYFSNLNEPVIADDSGLIVPALNNEPGIFSARYAGANATYKENNRLLLKNLSKIPQEKRTAFFQCVMVYKDQFMEKIFVGKCHGQIIEKSIGSGGFGYDPIFYIDSLKQTFAQLEIDEKNKISHRGKAVKALTSFLKKI